MIRVVVVDDQVLVRRAVVDILAASDDIEVVAEAADGAAAVERVRERRPDVVVMDLRMPVLDGIRATAEICADPQLAGTRVLVLTTFEEDANVVAALRAGAGGFLGKGAEPDAVVRAVRALHAGEGLFSAAATRSLIERTIRAAARPPVAVDLQSLTEREREVLLAVARGETNAEIAGRLVISPHTAKTHVNRIMTKLGAHDRAQLVIAAYEGGLLTPGGG